MAERPDSAVGGGPPPSSGMGLTVGSHLLKTSHGKAHRSLLLGGPCPPALALRRVVMGWLGADVVAGNVGDDLCCAP